MAQRLFTGTYRGLAKTLRFTDGSHTLEPRGALYFLFQAKGNVFRFLGRNDQVTPVQG